MAKEETFMINKKIQIGKVYFTNQDLLSNLCHKNIEKIYKFNSGFVREF